MKKLVIMLSLFFILLGSIAVMMYITNDIYCKTLDNLYSIEDSFASEIESGEVIISQQKVDDALAIWQDDKQFLLYVANHSLIHAVDEKFVSLQVQISQKNDIDGFVTIKTLINHIKDLQKENYPLAENIF